MKFNSNNTSPETPKTAAILLAGGKSIRMGLKDKNLEKLGEIPVLYHSLSTLNSSSEIHSIIVVVPKDKIRAYEEKIFAGKFTKVHRVCAGGHSRQASVNAALNFVQPIKWILIHDAARPFISKQMISDGIAAVKDTGAATAAIAMTDTLKLSEDDGSSIKHTIQRETIWAAQTPQIFSFDILKKAHENPTASDFTDDSSLIESQGVKVKMFPGSKINLKITSPADLQLASAILYSFNPSNQRIK